MKKEKSQVLEAPLASYAPLPASTLHNFAIYREKHICQEGPHFSVVRDQMVRIVMEAAVGGEISTTWLIKELNKIVPEGIVIERKNFPPWRAKGALEEQNIHKLVSLMVWRRMYRGERMMRLAPKMQPGQPFFYVFVQIVPGARPMLAAYPFPERNDVLYLLPMDASPDEAISLPSLSAEVPVCFVPWVHPANPFPQEEVQRLRESWVVNTRKAVQLFRKGQWCHVPPTTLVYSPYRGLVMKEDGTPDPAWFPVDGGAIRFLRPNISLSEVATWELQVARLNMEDERLVPAVVQRAREFALGLLAQDCLLQESDAISWRACP